MKYKRVQLQQIPILSCKCINYNKEFLYTLDIDEDTFCLPHKLRRDIPFHAFLQKSFNILVHSTNKKNNYVLKVKNLNSM